MDRSAQLAVSLGLLAMEASSGTWAAPAAAVCSSGRDQRKGVSRAAVSVTPLVLACI
jgi:hypothetical protein